MSLLEQLLSELKNNTDHEETISLLIFLSTLNPLIAKNMEQASQLICEAINQLIPNDFNRNFYTLMTSLRNNKRIELNSYTIHFGNTTFQMQVLFLMSLKYRKSLFVANDSPFLCDIIVLISDIFQVLDPLSLHLLKLLELLLTKRKDLLTADTSLLVLRITSRAVDSPICGFKHCTKNINRLIAKSLPPAVLSYLTDTQYWPMKDFDLNEALQLKTNLNADEKRAISEFIVKLFHYNTKSRDAALCYRILISLTDLEEFRQIVWPCFAQFLHEPEEEGEFYQCLLKYWLPITVKQYKTDFYNLMRDSNVDYKIRACALSELKKYGMPDDNLNRDVYQFLQYSATCHLGSAMLSTFTKKNQIVDEKEVKSIKQWLLNYFKSECSTDIIKNCKRFLSQLFLSNHIELQRSGKHFSLHCEFLHFIGQYCVKRIERRILSELPMELLNIVWNIGSGGSDQLVTFYKIDREDRYAKGENRFYRYLQQSGLWRDFFENDALVQAINSFPIRQFICPALVHLITERYLPRYHVKRSIFLDIDKSVCAGNSDNIKLLTSVEIAYDDYNCDIERLYVSYKDTIGIVEEKEMFYCVCVLEVLLTINNYPQNIDLFHLAQITLHFIERVIEDELHTEFNVKTVKIFESLVNNALDCLLKSKKNWSKCDKPLILQHLSIIIQKGNMKKPVTKAIATLQELGLIMEENEDDKIIKVEVLNKTLISLRNEMEKSLIKMRRNPETRLVIHALCVSDSKKYLLAWTMRFMLDILSDSNASNQSLSSTLNSLEVLISDNCLHQSTLEYIPEIILHAISLYNNTSWTVKNANVQIIKALVERFLGISLGIRQRPKSIEHVFAIFPQLVPIFYRNLSNERLDDGALVILLFISESQIKNAALSDERTEENVIRFRGLCLDVIKHYSNIYGYFAVNSFIALCRAHQIPDIFHGLAQFIKIHFVSIKKNVFANLFRLLKGLYCRYNRTDSISAHFNSLVAFLRPHCQTYFDFIYLRVLTYSEILDQACNMHFQNSAWECKIWLNNYLPYAIKEAPLPVLSSFVQKILFANVPDFLQEKIIFILIDRFSQVDIDAMHLAAFRNLFMLKVSMLDDRNKYLIIIYSKLVFLLNTLCDYCDGFSEQLIKNVRADCETKSLHKKLVYFTVLSNVEKTESDKSLLRSFFKLPEIGLLDDEYLSDVAANLISLYKCCVDRHDVINVFKLCFYLSLRECTCFEVCRFVSQLTGSQILSHVDAVKTLVNVPFLDSYLKDQHAVVKFLKEVRCFTSELPSEQHVESDTFYEIETDFWLSLEDVRDLIDSSLNDHSIHSL